MSSRLAGSVLQWGCAQCGTTGCGEGSFPSPPESLWTMGTHPSSPSHAPAGSAEGDAALRSLGRGCVLSRSSPGVSPSSTPGTESSMASILPAGMELGTCKLSSSPSQPLWLQLSASYLSLSWWLEAGFLPSWRWSERTSPHCVSRDLVITFSQQDQTS